MMERADAIAAMGVTHLWLPPPSHSVSPEGYLPQKLWDLDDSAYGTEAELKALCAKLKSRAYSSNVFHPSLGFNT